MEPNLNLSRRSSHDSDEWVVVNAQGSEIDNFACQTSADFDIERRTPEEIVELTSPTENLTAFAEYSTGNLQNSENAENALENSSRDTQVDEISLETIGKNNLFPNSTQSNVDVDVDASDVQCENEMTLETASEIDQSSSFSSDISMMNDVASLENLENEQRVENLEDQDVEPLVEADYVNFIQNEENNRRNVQSTNFFIWLAVGVACGVLIYQTSSCMKFLTSSGEDLSTNKADSESGFKKYQFDVNELRRQLAACKMSSKEYCERDDKPSCLKNVDDDAECSKKLEKMESYAKQFDMEHKALLDEVRELQANLTSVVSNYSQILSVKRRETNRLRRRNKRYEAQMKNADERNENSFQTETTLRRLLAQLENQVNTLKDDLRSVENDQKLFENLYKTCRSSNPDNLPFGGDFAKIFESLKTSTNFDDLLNVTTSFFDGPMKKLSELYENLQRNVDDATKSADVEVYLRRFKGLLVDNVGSTLSDWWQKAKDVSENLHNDCKSEFGHYCTFFNPFGDENETDDEEDSVEIHVDPATLDVDVDENKASETNSNDDDDATTFIHSLPTINDDESQILDDAFIEPLEIETSQNDDDDEQLLEKLAKEVKRFRNALKATNFDSLIDEDDVQQYYGRLKRLFKGSSANFDEISWWFCQQFWWSNDVEKTSNGVVVDCATKYLPWQAKRASRNSFGKTLSSSKKRNLIRQHKSLSDVVDEFSASTRSFSTDESTSNAFATNIGSEWLFERWRNRQTMRQDERRGFDESRWIFRRSKERDDWRKNERDKKGDRGDARKHRRKRYWGWQNTL